MTSGQWADRHRSARAGVNIGRVSQMQEEEAFVNNYFSVVTLSATPLWRGRKPIERTQVLLIVLIQMVWSFTNETGELLV